MILDCELSLDAKTVLFSWKKSMQEPFHLFTIPVQGGQPRRLTSGDHHNFNACWLPDGGIAFLSTRNPQFAYCWNSPVGVLHRMNADGGDVRRISANYLNDFTPAVMEDGRIIYGRWEYVDRPAIPIQSLWTIHPDGTMLSGYFGNRVLGPATFIEARAIPGGDGPRALHDDGAQRPLQRRDRDHRPEKRRQRPGGHHQRNAGGGHRQGDDQHQRPAAAAHTKALGRWTIATSS